MVLEILENIASPERFINGFLLMKFFFSRKSGSREKVCYLNNVSRPVLPVVPKEKDSKLGEEVVSQQVIFLLNKFLNRSNQIKLITRITY